MKRCIINFGKDGRERYEFGQQRLKESLVNDKSDQIFRTEYPEGCPPTSEVSHIFKAYMFKEAFDKGYDSVLWLDASVVVLKDIEYIWKCIEKDGHFFVNNPGCLQVHWASENQLEAMGCSVEEAERFCHCRSCVTGLRKDNKHYIDWMLKLPPIAYNGDAYSSSPLFKEPRHDQTIFSWIIHRDRLYKHPHYIARYTSEEDLGIAYFELKGM